MHMYIRVINVHSCMGACVYSSAHNCGCVVDGEDVMVAFRDYCYDYTDLQSGLLLLGSVMN